MIIDNNGVKDFLPHRKPFIFIDHVLDISYPNQKDFVQRGDTPKEEDIIGGTVHAQFKVDQDLEVLAGHFPGNPILPGVIQVEMMAQASSFLYTLLSPKKSSEFDIDVALLGVDKARFKIPVIPPMELDIYCQLIKTRSWLKFYKSEIKHKDKLVSSAEFMASIKLLD
jgi:3-hydroxyacyl-[acyl-carrier-protein] dehydratase